jgi:hypothetical protein
MHELLTKEMQLERKSHELARRARSGSGDDQKSAREELKTIATSQFEVRQQRRELHLKRLEEELKELRSSLQKRAEKKSELIERRVSELLGQKGDVDF